MIHCDRVCNFGQWLNDEMRGRGWTMSELGRRSGYSHASISNVINGITKPSWDFSAAMAKAFDYAPPYVFRMAGLLPNPPATPLILELVELIEGMSEEGRALLLPILRVLVTGYPAIPEGKEDTHPTP